MRRPEMTSEAASRLYWWVSQDLRRYALERFGMALGQTDKALSKTIDELLNYHQLDRTNDVVMMQIADWLNERQAISMSILPQVLRLGHFRLFNILLGRLTSLDLPIIDIIVSEKWRTAACRAVPRLGRRQSRVCFHLPAFARRARRGSDRTSA